MKHTSIKELFNKSVSELDTQVSEIFARIKKTRFEQDTGKLKNTNLAGGLRKDIARIKTVIKLKREKKQ